MTCSTGWPTPPVVRVDAPWLSPAGRRLDRMTAEVWAEENAHPDARTFFPLFLGEMMAADPADVSVLHMAFYLSSGGGIRYLNAFEGGASRTGSTAERTSCAGARRRPRRARPAGHRCAPSTRTARGHGALRSGASYTVRRRSWSRCRRCWPTRSTSARRCAGAAHGGHTARGCAVKVHLVYPEPLWREQGLSGWSVSSRAAAVHSGRLPRRRNGRRAHRIRHRREATPASPR